MFISNTQFKIIFPILLFVVSNNSHAGVTANGLANFLYKDFHAGSRAETKSGVNYECVKIVLGNASLIYNYPTDVYDTTEKLIDAARAKSAAHHEFCTDRRDPVAIEQIHSCQKIASAAAAGNFLFKIIFSTDLSTSWREGNLLTFRQTMNYGGIYGLPSIRSNWQIECFLGQE